MLEEGAVPVVQVEEFRGLRVRIDSAFEQIDSLTRNRQ